MTAPTATPTSNPAAGASGAKQQFLDFYERESATTLKVLKAFPKAQSEFTPHERSQNARTLANTFCIEQTLAILGMQDKLDLSGGFPKPPATWDEVVNNFEAGRTELLDLLRKTPDDGYFGTVKFFTAPGQMSDIPKIQFLWFLGCDQIHHRGQMSVYVRMAGGKVPSIYGPSADEPWF